MKSINVRGIKESLSESEMKKVRGGDMLMSTVDAENGGGSAGYSHCDKPKCKKASDCGPNAVCVTWSDCPNPTQGRCL